MFEWLSNLGKRPDHPMYNVAQAQKLLTDLPKDNAKALEEIASWLNTVTATEGFAAADRIGVLMLLDETAQAREPLVLTHFLRSSDLKDYERLHLWQVLAEFWEYLAAGYRLCLKETAGAAKSDDAAQAQRTVLVARALRALASEAKVLQLRYLPVRPQLWQALSDLYSLSEQEGIFSRSLKAYPTDALPTSARQEFLRALMLDASIPESERPSEVELAARVIARLGAGFILRAKPEPGCNFCFDLAHPARPVHYSPETPPSDTMRYFGAGVVNPALQEIVDRLAAKPEEPERRFGNDFSVEEKLIVLRHLLRYWGDQPPRRQGKRVKLDARMKIAHGFIAASELVTRVEFSAMVEMTEDMRVRMNQMTGIALEAQQAAIAIEEWIERDASTWGIGVDIPRRDESWVKIGELFAFEPAGLHAWWLGIVRRLYRDQQDHEHAGIEILAKKPLSVWLRGVGEGAQRAENWATSSGSFEFTYVNALILGEGANSGARREMLLPRDAFLAGIVYEVMMGEHLPQVRLEELLERGADYDRVRVSWLQS